MLLSGNEKKEKIYFYINEINTEIFKASLLTFLILFLIDTIYPRVVSNYFNFNILIILIIISGLIVFVFDNKVNIDDHKNENKFKIYVLYIIISIISGLIIYFNINYEKNINILISIITSIIILLMLILINKPKTIKYE
ncbi:MAG: hypothetical protein Q8P20_02765 [bacterium]|nr:hypothetical protein [bacterium]